jgi:hypothetical protein
VSNEHIFTTGYFVEKVENEHYFYVGITLSKFNLIFKNQHLFIIISYNLKNWLGSRKKDDCKKV